MTEHDIAEVPALLDRTVAGDIAPKAPWIALQGFTRQPIGAKLFTVTRVDMPKALMRQEYTSDPDAAPSTASTPQSDARKGDTRQTAYYRRANTR